MDSFASADVVVLERRTFLELEHASALEWCRPRAMSDSFVDVSLSAVCDEPELSTAKGSRDDVDSLCSTEDGWSTDSEDTAPSLHDHAVAGKCFSPQPHLPLTPKFTEILSPMPPLYCQQPMLASCW